MALWTAARQAPLSMGFSRQEHWSELPVSSPGDLSDPGIELVTPALQADSLLSEPPEKPRFQYLRTQFKRTEFTLALTEPAPSFVTNRYPAHGHEVTVIHHSLVPHVGPARALQHMDNCPAS